MNPVLILVTSDPNDGGKAWIGDDRNENQKSFEKNSRTTIHAAPAPGFRFLEWTFGDNQTFFSNDKDADITVTSQGTYTARFVEATEPELFTLEVNSSAGGSAMIEGDVNMFEAGTEVTVRAVAEPGYVFDGWFDSSTDWLESKSETYTFNITTNTSVYAKFSAIQASETYTLSLTAGSGGSVAIADTMSFVLLSILPPPYLFQPLPTTATLSQAGLKMKLSSPKTTLTLLLSTAIRH